IVGLEVTPTTASSRIRRSRSPSRSSGRERKSIQTLWPWAESWWRGDSAIGDLLRSGLLRRLATFLAASRAVSSDQLIVLVLLAAAFAAGWFARGGRPERGEASARRRRLVRLPRSLPIAATAAPH